MTSLQCVEAFSPTAVCFGGEQNHEGYEAPKRTISTQVGWGRYTMALSLSSLVYSFSYLTFFNSHVIYLSNTH